MVAHGGKLIVRNWCTERVVGGKCFWILGGGLGSSMALTVAVVVNSY